MSDPMESLEPTPENRARLAHILEHLAAYGETLRARGTEFEEVVEEIKRQGEPVHTTADGDPCWSAKQIMAAASRLAREVRVSLHLSRECPCGQGVAVPEDASTVFVMATGRILSLAIVPAPLLALPESEFDPVKLLGQVAFDAETRLRCPRCRVVGEPTHIIVMRDGKPVVGMPMREPWMELRDTAG